MAIIIPGCVPQNGSCMWVETSSACPASIGIRRNVYAGGAVDFSVFSPDFLSTGKYGEFCSSSSYVSLITSTAAFPYNGDFDTIDVWKAYADGLWTSSCVIDVYRGRKSGSLGCGTSPYAWQTPLRTKPINASSPSSVDLATTGDSGGVCDSCPTSLAGTLTVYDDGTYTFT
jgi:hypothetical protein